MSNFFNELKNEMTERNQNKETLSLRLSTKEMNILSEMANTLECTRQEIITRLIQKYVVSAWEAEYAKDKIQNEQDNIVTDTYNLQETGYYLLNTNSVHDTNDEDFMLKNGFAAAFEDGYKEKIERLGKNDWVFLYSSSVGIVAYGQATGEILKTHHYGIENKTFYQKLDNFQILKKPIKAHEVRSILGRNFPFAQTLSYIYDGDKLVEFISKM